MECENQRGILEFRHCGIPSLRKFVIAREQSDRSNLIQILIKRLNNEIASSFVSLTPRNDGILEFSVMKSPKGLGDDKEFRIS